jgi:hypothetical protein
VGTDGYVISTEEGGKTPMKKLTVLIVAIAMALTLAGCREAERVSYNVSKEADNFNVCRQITVINIRDDKVLYTLEGFFSIQNEGNNELCVISEVGDGKYKKDFIYLSEWTTYVCTDLNGSKVSRYHYELNILPQMVGGVTITAND